MFKPAGLTMPTFVVETGWSESRTQLLEDMNLWLVGVNGAVKAVLILIWRQVGNTTAVRGDAEYCTLDRTGTVPILIEQHRIFPAPAAPQAAMQTLNPTRRILFGTAMQPGLNPNDVFPMRFNELRNIARDALAEMGLVPAV
ncbi:hypothetical protein CDV55_102049 [Aspergillus turcosus]|nr:hypothetical protein CDV55_102049 [Aspergillus turcosus]